jgi:mono/diheme cytochrome c family protein
MKPQVILAGAVASLIAAHAVAQEVGDVRAGAAFAREVCAECHAVEAKQVDSPDLGAPSFQRIASIPGMTGTALIVALRSTPRHRTMPLLTLEQEEMRNVIAYILSLKPE